MGMAIAFRVTLAGVTVLASAAAFRVARRPFSPDAPVRLDASAPAAAPASSVSVRQALSTIVARDPFRKDRRPSRIRFGDEPPPAATQVAPRRPALGLVGVVLGSEPAALISESTFESRRVGLYLSGARVAGFSVLTIDADSVVLAAPESTLVLRLARYPR